MTWGKVLRFAAELTYDLIREALRGPKPIPWDDRHTEIKARAQRCAGHETEPQCKR